MSRAPIRRSLVVASLVAATGSLSVATAPSASAAPAFGAYTNAVSSPSNVLTYKSATVYCPSNRRVIAAGAKIVGAGGQAVIAGVTPNASLSSVFVTAYADGATTAWSVVAYASCGLTPVGIERVEATSAFTSADKAVTATCSGTKRLLSLSGSISGGSGRVVMGMISPKSDLKSGYIAAREGDPITSNWQLKAYAICAAAPSGLRLYYANSAFNSATPKSMLLKCPTGMRVVSVAAELPTISPVPPSDVSMSELYWDAGYNGALLTAEENDPYAGSWLLTGLVICANG